MRELRFLGVSADGTSLMAECCGEHFRLPLDDAVRRAVTTRAVQMSMPLDSALSPREIQQRIRHGESAADIARAAGVPVEQVARFEGPVVAERAHQAGLARRATVAGRSLAELVDEHLAEAGLPPEVAAWDAWRVDDDRWRVRLEWHDGAADRTACWSWEPGAARLRPLDTAAKAIAYEPEGDQDDLTAVLRRVGSPRREPTATADTEPWLIELPRADVVTVPPEDDTDEPADDHDPHEEPVADPLPTVSARRQRRVSVPSWDEITGRARRTPDIGDASDVTGVTDGRSG